MTGITALLSSGAFTDPHAIPDDNAVQVFYNDKNNNLGLLFQSAVDEDDSDLAPFSAEDTALSGNIITGSALDSAPLNGVPFVAAITKPPCDNCESCGMKGCKCGCKKSYNDVSIVSPIYRPIGKISNAYTNLAFTTDRKAVLYFYYQDGEKLLEHRVKPKGNKEDKPVPLTAVQGTIVENSPLAAFYSGETRFVYYINKVSNIIYEYNCTTKNAAGISESDNVNLTGSFDVSYNPTKKTIYLYFVNRNQQLRRLSREIHSSDFKVDGIVKKQSDDLLVGKDSQVSVAVAKDINHVFYLGQEEGVNIQHVVDNI